MPTETCSPRRALRRRWRRRPTRRRYPAAAVLALLLVSAACGGQEVGQARAGAVSTSSTAGGPGDTDSTSSTADVSTDSTGSSASTDPTSTSSSTSAAPTPAGCTGGPSTIPAGAAQGPVPDVDGDGQPDTAWVATDASGQVRAGVVTAAGGGAERPWNSASPVTRSLFVTDVNDGAPVVLVASDGRLAQLWAFVDCTIVDVDNIDGDPYLFSLGVNEFGTGVGCTQVDGRRELIGLNITDDDGTTVSWTSTVINVSGTVARNGARNSGTFTRPDDDRSIALLRTVACGARTIEADGITFTP